MALGGFGHGTAKPGIGFKSLITLWPLKGSFEQDSEFFISSSMSITDIFIPQLSGRLALLLMNVSNDWLEHGGKLHVVSSETGMFFLCDVLQDCCKVQLASLETLLNDLFM